jgi:hypothetical protein
VVSLQAWGFALRAATPQVAFGYDPTGRSVYYTAIDRLTFILLLFLFLKARFLVSAV